MEQQFELILSIVNRGHADEVMDAARSVGATGGTVLHARGAGVHEAEKFFGVFIQPEKEVVMILVPRELKKEIMRAICREAGLSTEGRGLSFSLPVDEIVGVAHRNDEERE